MDKNIQMTLIEKDIQDEEKKKKISVFGDKPFRHICECCRKVEILTCKEAYEQGWNYPGEGDIYPSSMFGVITPRTCGITETVYWTIVVEKKQQQN